MNIQEIRQKYPQYSDLSDEQLGQALHAKFYSDMPYAEFAQKAGIAKADEPGILSRLGRQVGLTARAVPNAVLSAVAPIGDVLTGGRTTPAVQRVLNSVFPEPANGVERVAQDVAGGMLGGAGLAKLTGTGATMLTQTLASGGGALGAGTAREMGAGPLAQIAAGIAGGVVAPSVYTTAAEGSKAALRGARGMVEPFTEQGRRTIAARTMQANASNRQAAADAIDAAPEYVPGSMPTTAEASGDMGLAGLQKAMRNQRPAEFADRAASQDAARQAYLDKVFGGNVSQMEAERNASAGAIREAAFEAAGKKKIDTKPVVNMANSILKSGAGKRQEVERAMEWVKSRLDGETNAQRLDAIRQDINDIIAGKMAGNPEKASLVLASKELAVIRERLTDQINARAPLYREYLKEYREQSIPIGKQKLGKDILASATNNTTERLSTPKFANQMATRGDEIGATMGARESDMMYRTLLDMRRSAAPDSAMRVPGSDTLQNLVGQNMLQRAGVGKNGPVGKMAAGLLGKVYGPLEAQTQELLLQGLLDPNVGKALLSQQISKDPQLAEELLRRLLVTPGAGLLGVSVAQ